MPTDASPAPERAAPHFSAAERESFHRLLASRRDMRHFARGVQVDEAQLQRLLHAIQCAPSVGLMQPWRVLRIVDAALRGRIAELVEAERLATAAALAERGAERGVQFMQLKVEGIRDCAELWVVALAPDDGTVFGRRTLPEEMALCSLACAIQNLWLAARADNLGLGWVSMFEPEALAQLLHMPAGARPMAVLCIGPVDAFYDEPMLQRDGWRVARPIAELVFTDRWGDAVGDAAAPADDPA